MSSAAMDAEETFVSGEEGLGSSRFKGPPLDRITARSTTFWSSRMLPGQSYSDAVVSWRCVKRGSGTWKRWQACRTK